jgi:hypothetical protein
VIRLETSVAGVQYASSERQAAVRGTLLLDGGSVGVGGLAAIDVELSHPPAHLTLSQPSQARSVGHQRVWYRVSRAVGLWLSGSLASSQVLQPSSTSVGQVCAW